MSCSANILAFKIIESVHKIIKYFIHLFHVPWRLQFYATTADVLKKVFINTVLVIKWNINNKQNTKNLTASPCFWIYFPGHFTEIYRSHYFFNIVNCEQSLVPSSCGAQTLQDLG